MSASSLWVTWGTFSQERCRNGPEIFLIRGRGWVCVGPNLEKSWGGISGIPVPAAAGAAAGAAGPLRVASRSSLVIRPFSPVPRMVARSTPSSRARRRTLGPAWGMPAAAPSPDGPAGAGAGAAEGAAWAEASAAAATPDTSAGDGSCCWTSAACWSSAAAGWTAPSPPRVRMRSPSLTSSPTDTARRWTTPSAGEGTSMVALSDSRVMSGSSGATVSPAATWTSITGTPLKSPMSGTLTSMASVVVVMGAPQEGPNGGRRTSAQGGVRLLGVDAVLLDGVGDLAGRHRALLGQAVQGGHGHVVAVNLEERAQRPPVVGAPVAVGAEHRVAAGDERADLVGVGLDVVGGRDHRPALAFQAGLDIALARRLGRVEAVPALGAQPVAAQLGEAGGAPDVGRDPPVLFQQLGPGDHLTQDGAAAQQLDPGPLAAAGRALAEQVQALADALLGPLGHGRVLVVLVHQGDVVVDVLLLGVHAPQAVLDDHRHLIGPSRVVGHDVGDGGGEHVAVPVLVLEALAVQGRPPGRAPEQEPAGPHVPGRPGQVAEPLEPEHRVVDVERDHRQVVGAVGGGRGHP